MLKQVQALRRNKTIYSPEKAQQVET